MASKLADDPRIDPRIKAIFGDMPVANPGDAASRADMLAEATAPGAEQRAEFLKALLDSVDRKLAALDNLDLDKQDRSSLDQMRVISTLLHQQGQELQAFWDSGADENAARYEDVRKDSWAAISRLTGIGR